MLSASESDRSAENGAQSEARLVSAPNDQLASRPLRRRTAPSLIAICIAASSAVFFLDVSLHQDLALPVLYVAVIWAATASPRSEFALGAALLCSVLTVLGMFLSEAGASDFGVVVFNRLLFLFILWLSTLLLLQQKGAERKLRRLSLVARRTSNSVMLTDPRGIIEWVNEGFIRISGYRLEDVFGRRPEDLLYGPETDSTTARHIRDQIAREDTYHVDILHYDKSGNPYWVEVQAEPLFDDTGAINGYFAVQTDITDRKEHEDRLKVALKEKEVLLKEIHHRVKNNLQVISSLIGLQSRRTSAPEAVTVLKESENRIHSISLLHENLYRAEDLSHIDFRSYMKSLTNHIVSSYGVTDSIAVEIHSDGLALEADQAIPCGLIVNELVSNSIKHGFQQADPNSPCTIRVGLRERTDGMLELTVTDNGACLPNDIEVEKAPTLGLKLVQTLTRQLQGTLTVERRGGTTFRLVFPKET
ncbi:MAG: PAS domain-containing protein [Bdellovibrionales bacterium]|nr:PAS domain-containing protein [Bdellovibrionales bacterium]